MQISEKTVIPIGFAITLGVAVWWASATSSAVAALKVEQTTYREAFGVLQDIRVEMASMKTVQKETADSIERIRDFLRRKIK